MSEATPYEPIAVEPRFPAPRGRVSPHVDEGWFRRLSPIILARRGTIAFALTCAALMVFLQLRIPLITRDALDKALVPAFLGQTDAEPLSRFVVLLAILAVTRFACGFIYRYGLQRVALGIEADMRNVMYEHMSRLSFSFYDRVQTGQLVSRANSDIRAIQMFLTMAPTVAITLMTFVIAVVVMVQIHVLLTLAAIATVPLVYVTGLSMRSKMFPISWVVSARTADMATVVEENVTGVRVVKSFAAEAPQISLLKQAADRLLWASNKQVEIRARFSPLMQNFPQLSMALVLLYGGHLVIDGKISSGDLVVFFQYIAFLQAPFMMIGFLMIMSQRAAASAARIFEILDEAPEIVDRPGAVDLVDPQGDVVFDDVTFGYAEGPDVLAGFDLHIAPGETVAMVGRTGCGKSTAARLIPRFYDVRSGEVRIDGRPVTDYTVPSLRAAVGLVLDEPFLFSESVRDNIAYGALHATDAEIEAAARAAGAHDFIMELSDGYDTVIGERGYTLSGGQRQRIAIARTLLVNPPVLILDDATSAVDVHREQEIHDALKTLMAGRTTLIIAHRLSTISLADRVVLVEGGRIVADGTHAELMATVPSYAEVLAHGEEDYEATHAPPPDPEEVEAKLPSRLRAMKHLAEARAAAAAEAPTGEMATIPGGGA